jgi:hypothetical protein
MEPRRILHTRHYTGPSDHTRINLSDDHDLRYWTARFDVTPDELRCAVSAVGDSPALVEEHFRTC